MAFHPDFRTQSTPPTPPETVLRARQIALACGMSMLETSNIVRRNQVIVPVAVPG